MEYERIHEVQNGIISPSKLRMKLIGPHHQRKKDGSNSNSSRTSPSRLEDSEFVKNSLLAAESVDFDEEASSTGFSSIKLSENSVPAAGQGNSSALQEKELMPRENGVADRRNVHQFSKGDCINSSLVLPVRTYEDENLDYDSTSSFEFHRAERSNHHFVTRSFSRPMPSKWNDAEKWIMNRQNGPPNNSSKKIHSQNQSNRVPAMNMVRVVPESANSENMSWVKRVDFCQPAAQSGLEKFTFVQSGSVPVSIQGNGVHGLIDSCPESRDLMEVENKALSCIESLAENTAGIPTVRSVSMRDMGTEMTPIPSQEPSRTATPTGATPLRSPTSSIPSTPQRGEPAPSPPELSLDNASEHSTENGKKEMSEQELKLKTRREIVALGVQLGKMNIATWASKDEKDKSISVIKASDADELERIEFANRAVAWEEAEKSKHTARFKREEIKIQAWESQKKSKIEAEMRRTEAQVEQIRAKAQAKMVKKIAMARQKSEEKRAAVESRRDRHAKKVAEQAEYIRQTGRLPSSSFICCGWS